MRIFELYFNPKLKEDHCFESFSYQPQTSYEKKLGSLHQVGELNNCLPQNTKLLSSLSKEIKSNYYNISFKSQERALTESLKKANEFLGQELKKDNVSWLGNLNYVSLSFKDSNIVFTKTGDIKILMLRHGLYTDIAKNLEIEKIEPYPLKVFFNIVSGKIIENDAVLVITKSVYDYLNQKKVLEKLAKAGDLDENKIKQVFPESLFLPKDEKSLEKKSKASGICYIAVVKKEFKKEDKKTKNIFLAGSQKEFSFKEVFAPLSDIYAKILKRLLPKKSKKAFLKPDKKTKLQVNSKELPLKNKIILISVFLILIFLGFFILKNKKDPNAALIQRIEEKVKEGQKSLIYKNEDSAKILFKEAWQEASDLPETKKALILKKEIEENLNNLSNIERLDDIRPFYEISSFQPDSLSLAGSNLFLYKKGGKDLYKLSLEKKELEQIILENNIDLAGSDSDVFFAFSKTNTVLTYKNSLEKTETSLSDILLMAPYYKGIYFLDNKECQVVKLAFTNNDFSLPSKWLKDPVRNEISNGVKPDCSIIKSMAVDGSLWLLSKDNSIDVFYKGLFQKTIKIDVFPEGTASKIAVKIDALYVYLLDKEQKRIILYDKEGKYIKQITSLKFDSLSDFSISENGKEIYLLSGSKVYKIEI